jgi:hypothetical protein
MYYSQISEALTGVYRWCWKGLGHQMNIFFKGLFNWICTLFLYMRQWFWSFWLPCERENNLKIQLLSPQKEANYCETISAHTKSTDIFWRTLKKYWSSDTIPLKKIFISSLTFGDCAETDQRRHRWIRWRLLCVSLLLYVLLYLQVNSFTKK